MKFWHSFQGLKIVDYLKKNHIYPFFRVIDKSSEERIHSEDKDLVMLSSNNYLSLTHNPRVIEETKQAIEFWGTGCTGSRFLNGNLSLHIELENEIAQFLGYESCLVFATGFMANQGAISVLTQEGDYILSDDHNHACIIEGCKLSKAQTITYKHNDIEELEDKLKSLPADSKKMIITDGVFSMTGKVAKLDKISALAKKYQALFYLDDAHGVGVLGQTGQGSAEEFNIKPDVLMGTFSKSFASQGGYICADKKTVDWIKMKARTFMFSAALSPANTQAALSAIRVLKDQPELAKAVKEKAKYLNQCLNDEGIETYGAHSAIVSMFIGNDKKALYLSTLMHQKGFFICPVVYPAVPVNQAVIRCSVTAQTKEEDLKRFAEIFSNEFKKVPKEGAQLNAHEFLDKDDLSEKDLEGI